MPSNSNSFMYKLCVGLIVVDISTLVIAVIILISKALKDTIEYSFVASENVSKPKYKIYKEVPRKAATPIEAAHMWSNNYSAYNFDKFITSEIVHLNRKGIVIFEYSDMDPEYNIIVRLADLDEVTRSKLTQIEQYILTVLEGMFEGDLLFLGDLIEKIQIFVIDIINGEYRSRRTVLNTPTSKLYFKIAVAVKQDFVSNKIIDEEKHKENSKVICRMAIFMILLSIPFFAFISLNVSEELNKLFTLPFLWWHFLVFVGGFGFISSIFALFKKDNYTFEGREERAKWRGFRNYLKSKEIMEDIRLNYNILNDVLPYLFVYNAPKKTIKFVLDNLDESTIDMKAIKIMYKSVI